MVRLIRKRRRWVIRTRREERREEGEEGREEEKEVEEEVEVVPYASQLNEKGDGHHFAGPNAIALPRLSVVTRGGGVGVRSLTVKELARKESEGGGGGETVDRFRGFSLREGGIK